MAEVKWIKLATGLPDNKKIKQIRRLPDGDTIALMWVFLLCLAGETNEDGMIYFTPEIPDEEFNNKAIGISIAPTEFKEDTNPIDDDEVQADYDGTEECEQLTFDFVDEDLPFPATD